MNKKIRGYAICYKEKNKKYFRIVFVTKTIEQAEKELKNKVNLKQYNNKDINNLKWYIKPIFYQIIIDKFPPF